MKIGRRKLSYGIALTVALCAFAYDWVFDGTKTAAANAPAIPPAQVRNATNNVSQQDAGAARLSAVAARLRACDSALELTGSTNDPFSAPSSWKKIAAQAGSDKSPAIITQESAAFCAAHHLTAVLARGSSGVVYVDEKIVRMGQSLDGFRLVGVDDKSATFVRDNIIATLTLDDPLADSAVQSR